MVLTMNNRLKFPAGSPLNGLTPDQRARLAGLSDIGALNFKIQYLRAAQIAENNHELQYYKGQRHALKSAIAGKLGVFL